MGCGDVSCRLGNIASQTLAMNNVTRFVCQLFSLFLLASSSLVLDSPKEDTVG